MAWTRSPRGRRRFGGRRFFRRRRGFRQTTEQGARIERCNFNFGVDQPISSFPGTPQHDLVMAASPQSLINGLTGAGSQAAAVARVLALPIRDLSVSGFVLDVDAVLSGGTNNNDTLADLDLNTTIIQCGFAIYTMRLDSNGEPVTTPAYERSQWPINTEGFNDDTEDNDYATRTHFHRSFTLAPDEAKLHGVDPAFWTHRGRWPHYRERVRVKIKRRISDNYGLFFGFWNLTPSPLYADQFGGSESVFWRLNGSMWYKLRM